jgi:hypothetical protein
VLFRIFQVQVYKNGLTDAGEKVKDIYVANHVMHDLISPLAKTEAFTKKMKKTHRILIILLLLSFFQASVGAQEAKKENEQPPLPSKTFTADFNLVWDKVVETLKANDFPLASSDKDSGKMTTVTKKYFRILSANFPPIEKDYRDTYVIQLSKAGDKSTRAEIERKFEIHNSKTNAWDVGDPHKEKEGLSEEDIFKAIQLQLAGAAK